MALLQHVCMQDVRAAHCKEFWVVSTCSNLQTFSGLPCTLHACHFSHLYLLCGPLCCGASLLHAHNAHECLPENLQQVILTCRSVESRLYSSATFWNGLQQPAVTPEQELILGGPGRGSMRIVRSLWKNREAAGMHEVTHR